MLNVIFSHFFRKISVEGLLNVSNTLTLVFCDFVLTDAIPCFTYFLFIFSRVSKISLKITLPNASNTLTLILCSQTLYHALRYFFSFFRDFPEITLKITLPNASNTLHLIFCDFVLTDAIPCFTYFLFIFSEVSKVALPDANNILTFYLCKNSV